MARNLSSLTEEQVSCCVCVNLEFRGNYSATSNNIKLVHWLLIGGLLHLVQQLYQM